MHGYTKREVTLRVPHTVRRCDGAATTVLQQQQTPRGRLQGSPQWTNTNGGLVSRASLVCCYALWEKLQFLCPPKHSSFEIPNIYSIHLGGNPETRFLNIRLQTIGVICVLICIQEYNWIYSARRARDGALGLRLGLHSWSLMLKVNISTRQQTNYDYVNNTHLLMYVSSSTTTKPQRKKATSSGKRQPPRVLSSTLPDSHDPAHCWSLFHHHHHCYQWYLWALHTLPK